MREKQVVTKALGAHGAWGGSCDGQPGDREGASSHAQGLYYLGCENEGEIMEIQLAKVIR